MNWEQRKAAKVALVENLVAPEIERLKRKNEGSLKNEVGHYQPEVKELAVELVNILSSHSLPSRGPVLRLLGVNKNTLLQWVATVPYTRNKHIPASVQQQLDYFDEKEDS